MNKKILIICLAILLLMPPTLCFASSEWKTWGSDRPKIQKQSKPSLVSRMFKYYHEKISSNDGASCPFYPTCSAYSLQAIRRFGLIKGGLLTIDRFTREYPGMPEHGHYPLITKYGYHRPYDPIPEK